MPYNYSGSSTVTGGGNSGTLASQGLYQGIAPPRNSQATGIQGTDGRAYTRNVQGNELVQNQMNDLLAGDSRYIQSARNRGLAQANSRGMLNSSIAAGTAERAGIESAMPIAQADAATYGRTQSENMGALNSGLMQERDLMNQQSIAGLNASTQRAGIASQARTAQMQAAAAMQQQRESLAFAGEQQGLDRMQALQMADFQLQGQYGLNNQQYQQNLGLNQQGYNFDLGRMEAGDMYDDRNWQRAIYRDANTAGLNAASDWYGVLSRDLIGNSPAYADPAILQTAMSFGPMFQSTFMQSFNGIYGP